MCGKASQLTHVYQIKEGYQYGRVLFRTRVSSELGCQSQHGVGGAASLMHVAAGSDAFTRSGGVSEVSIALVVSI